MAGSEKDWLSQLQCRRQSEAVSESCSRGGAVDRAGNDDICSTIAIGVEHSAVLGFCEQDFVEHVVHAN